MFTVTFYLNKQEMGSFTSDHDDTHKVLAEAREKLNGVLPMMIASGMNIRETEIAIEPLDLQLFLAPDWSLTKDRLTWPVPSPPKVMAQDDEEIIS